MDLTLNMIWPEVEKKVLSLVHQVLIIRVRGLRHMLGLCTLCTWTPVSMLQMPTVFSGMVQTTS